MLLLSSPELFWDCTGECAALDLYTISTISTDLIVTLIERHPEKSFKCRELQADITTKTTKLPWMWCEIKTWYGRSSLTRLMAPWNQCQSRKTFPQGLVTGFLYILTFLHMAYYLSYSSLAQSFFYYLVQLVYVEFHATHYHMLLLLCYFSEHVWSFVLSNKIFVQSIMLF